MPGAYLKPAYIQLSDGHWPGSLVACLVTRSSDSHHSSQSCQCIQLKSSSLSLSFMVTPQSGFCSVARCLLKYKSTWTFREIFECTQLKFTVSGRSKPASIHTRVCSGSPQLYLYCVCRTQYVCHSKNQRG